MLRRRAVLLAAFMAGELAVLLFLLAQRAWPRAIPEALGWAVYFGTYPWSLAWLAQDIDEPAATMAILAASFALNVMLVAAVAGYAIERWSARQSARAGGDGMTRATKVKVASALMGVGVVPMMLWFAMLANAVRELRLGDFDLSDVMFTGVAGLLAYLSTLVVGGAGALWWLGLRRDAPDAPRRVARNLAWLVAGVLVLPWLAVGALFAMRAVG